LIPNTWFNKTQVAKTIANAARIVFHLRAYALPSRSTCNLYFQDEFDQMDFIRLANCRAYIKLMINGAPSKPFSASTIAPQQH